MRAIPYRITLLEPLLATRIAGDPNSAVSYPYVPGSMVRGAAVAAYLRDQGLSSLDAGAEDVRRLFFDGRTRFLNAYPVDDKGDRTLPTPRSLFDVKNENGPVYDFAHEVLHEVHDEKVQFTAAARETQPFCRIDGAQIHFISLKRRVNVHTKRDRVKGRATEKNGAVFQYDAIDKGQVLFGWALVDDDADAERLIPLLQTIQRFGGSSNSGYGRVSTEVDASQAVGQKPWREAPGANRAIEAGDTFVLTLLSDTLVRDVNTGQNTWDILPCLTNALGVAIERVQVMEEEEQRGVWRLEAVGGFNRTWGLPLPQAQAIAGGSVFVFQTTAPISSQMIADLEWRGIGERRAEGFGRLVFNWQQEAKLSVVNTDKGSPTTSSAITLPAGAATIMATQMAERMLRRELAIKLRKTIYETRIQGRPAISNAQLSRMRVIVRDALPDGDTERLHSYVKDNIEPRWSVRDQFDRTRFETRLGKERLSRWLEDLLQDPETVWRKIGAQNLSQRIGANVEATTEGNQELAREYTLRLIDGILARLAKERRKEDGGNR